MTHNLKPVADRIRAEYKPRMLDFTALEVGIGECYAQNLRRLRAEFGWGQMTISDVMGVSRTQYRNYEQGGSFPKMSTTARFMQVTGVPFPYFFLGSAYESLFSTLHIRSDWLPLQIFAGRASDIQFAALVDILEEHLDRKLAKPEILTVFSWPEATDVQAELDQYYELVAQGLRQFREVVGCSQDDMAEMLGTTQRTLCRYEDSGEEPHFSVVMALRLWAATGIAPIWLMYGTCFFRMRMLQHQRMGFLGSLLNDVPARSREQITNLVRQVSRLTL
ncbi:MAG: helix-turn-helix domain-containing protein [Natronospirillum sp.]|uniref:helix-turn-helix domain-containing protein n=1 Tax=Natronospirillum sp. TaxID=2812955 RepID=UPI0025DCCAA4|nr:helix-turn-helix domain-containing protein [Natronospirillum sp.]MCH8552199.1 helix-turn-helix domain-containing protein [Natronospirillum sp.]